MLTNNIIFYTNISLPIDVYMDKLNQFFLSNPKLDTSLYIIKYKNIKLFNISLFSIDINLLYDTIIIILYLTILIFIDQLFYI